MSYAPNLIVERSTRLSKVRELPLLGKTLVNVGDAVEASTPVLSAELPGELIVVRVADLLGIDPERVFAALRVKEQESITRGQLLAEHYSFFGLFRDQVFAPETGTVEYFLKSTGHLGLRLPSKALSVCAYLSGKVVEIGEGRSVTIETSGALIQGIFGVGGEQLGIVSFLDSGEGEITPEKLQNTNLSGKILCGGSHFHIDAIHYAAEAGAVGIVTASITSAALEKVIGRSLGISMTGDEELSFSLMVTEGFGTLRMSERVVEILSSLNGKRASMSGATQVRAGAIRPELIVPSAELLTSVEKRPPIFESGRKVRCLRAPYFGFFGEIVDLPHKPVEVSSGAIVRVAMVRLENGETVAIPRANLELAG
jgi:hypothetical protein